MGLLVVSAAKMVMLLYPSAAIVMMVMRRLRVENASVYVSPFSVNAIHLYSLKYRK